MVEEVKTLFYACNPCSKVDSPHPRFLDFVQEARLLYIGSNVLVIVNLRVFCYQLREIVS